MTPEQLATIQARADAATEGPWYWDADKWLEGKRGYVLANDSVVDRDLIEPVTVRDADATFIAHARTDVPALLALVRKQQAALAKVELALDAMDAGASIRSGDPRTKSYAAVAIRAAIRAALTATEGAA